MFKTYGEKLVEIESHYEKKDYEYVVVECAKITEQAVGQLFRNFHMSLDTPAKRLKFLEFEKGNGEKYSSFLLKPTIGVGIGFYNSLIEHCSDHPWIKPELKSSLNTINSTRNAQVHAGKPVIADHEAGEVIDATEKFLKGIELFDLPVEDVGFPLKYYLVYTSIKSKFEKGETEIEFKRIINDSNKLIPDLLNSVFNKVYPFLSIEDKEKLNKLHPKTLKTNKKDTSLKYFIEIFEEINLFAQITDGDALKSSLQAMDGDLKDMYSRRAVRHHVNVLDNIFNFIQNKKLNHFLDYANLLKKKFLEDNQINDTDRIILNDRAKELNISPQVADTIEKAVVRTIEKELILFQTLHEDKKSNGKVLAGEGADGVGGSTGGFGRRNILIGASVLALFVIALFFIFKPKSDLTAYERAHLECRHDKVIKIAGKKRSLTNIKANYHYIFSNFINNSFKIPEEVKYDYQELLRLNPESPEAKLYLGFIYSWSPWWVTRYEADSSCLLINSALDQGIESPYADMIKLQLFESWELPSMIIKALPDLTEKYPDNPRVLEYAAQSHLNYSYDTIKAKELYEAALEIYPDYFWYYIKMSRIAELNDEIGLAEEMLSMARGINSENVDLLNASVRILLLQNKYEEAEKIVKNAINGYGKNNIRPYLKLLELYSQTGKSEEGLNLTQEALEMFPNNSELLNNLVQFKEVQKMKERLSSDSENHLKIHWNTDYNEALTKSQNEGKPIFAAFVTDFGNTIVEAFLSENISNDSSIINILEAYIPVKLITGKDSDIFKKFNIEYPRRDVFVLSGDEKKIQEFTYQDTRSSDAFKNALNTGIQRYKRHELGKSLNTESYTEVHNFKDALVMAKARDYIIMVIAGAEDNEFSQKLIDEILVDPVFQSQFNNLVYLYLEQDQDINFMKKYEIKSFPTVLYFKKSGELIHKSFGFKPADLLAEMTFELKESAYKGEKYEAELNWLYNFKEAQTIAMIENKKIFVARNSALLREHLLSPDIKAYLSNNYVCVNMDEISYREGISFLGFYNGYGSIAILEPSGNLLFHNTTQFDTYQLLSWLNIEEKLIMVAVLGVENYGKYQEKVMLAKQLNERLLYGSSIDIYKEAIEILPDNYENYYSVANAYLSWFKPEQAIEYFSKALDHGLMMSLRLCYSMTDAYLQMENEEGLIAWFEKMMEKFSDDTRSLAILYEQASIMYEILQMMDKAVESAKYAVSLVSDDFLNQSRYGILLFKSDRISEAKVRFKKAVEINSSSAYDIAFLGLCANKEGNKADRDQYLRKAQQIEPNVERQMIKMDYWLRPNYYKYPGYIDMIEEGYLNAVIIDTTFWTTYNDLAYLYSIEGIKLDLALDYVERTLKENPDDHLVLDTKAWVLYKLGRFEEADNVMAKVTKLTPQEEIYEYEYLYHKGMIALAVGDTVAGKEALKRAYNTPEPDAIGMRIKEEIEPILSKL